MKKILSIFLTLAILLPVIKMPVQAMGEPVYLPQSEISGEVLESGEFYLATHTAEIHENSGAPHVFKVARGGTNLPAAEVKLNMIDITAKYGNDYTIKVHNSSKMNEKVENVQSNVSLLEQLIEHNDEIIEENYTDDLILTEGMSPEELEALYMEDLNLLDAYLTEEVEGYEEEKNAYIENAEAEASSGEEATKVPGKSLKDAKEIATGLESDKVPMSGGSDAVAAYAQEMLQQMSMKLESAYLLLEFEDGETEKYIEIIPENNNLGDGDRVFSVNLFAVSDNAFVGANGGMNVSIIDDESQELATLSFAKSKYYPEDGFIAVTIERTGALNQIVSVDVKTEDITAVKGRDYSEVETSVAFPYGITERTINIPVRSDYITETAKFKINMSNAVNCYTGDIKTAYGFISPDSESFEIYSEPETQSLDSGSRTEANVSSYITGESLKIADTFSAWVSSNAQDDSFVMAEGDGIKMYTKSSSGGASSEVKWDMGERYDMSGIAIDWTKESGKPCYTDNYVYGKIGNRDVDLFSTGEERWEQRTTNVYFTYEKVTEFFIKQNRDGGFFGKSPTLTIHSIKPIMRPFEITLKGADPIKFLNANGEYVDNTTISDVSDANNALLRNATNTGAGTVIKFGGDTFTVTSSSKYSYIKGLRIINNRTGKSTIIRDNLASGTTSVSVTMDNDFLKEYKDYIAFYDNDTLGKKGAFSVQPIMAHYDTSVKIYKDYRGGVSYNGSPEVKEESDGVRLTYHKGDEIRLTQTVNPFYESSYTASRIRVLTKLNSTAPWVDNMPGYDNGTNYVTLRNQFSDIEVYPNFDKKDNHIVVRVAKSDVEKFKNDTGIFTLTGVEVGDYMEYTVVESDVFAAGVYYEFTAKAKDAGYTPVWQKINTDVKYSQSTFYFRPTNEIEENIIYLTCEEADDMEYILTGDAYYSNVALRSGNEGAAWMAANGVGILIGSDKYGFSDENGKFKTASMYGINGMNVVYKTIASGNVEYKTTTLNNSKTAELNIGEGTMEVYDVNIGTIKAASSNVTSPYVTSVTASNDQGVETGYVTISNKPTVFTVAISNNGAKYIDSDGVERAEKVKSVDLLVYDPITHVQKFEITGLTEVSDNNGISIWSSSFTFMSGESISYSASDELYVRVTTDKVVGNGKGYNAEGEFTEIDALMETVYAPVNTGYTFEEANRKEPVTQGFDLDFDTSYVVLPFIGSMNSSFSMRPFSLTLSSLPNGGQRVSFGYTFRFDDNAKKELIPDDGGIKDENNPDALGKPYSITNLSKMAQGVKNFGKELSNEGSLFTKIWGFGLILGIYIDFGIKAVHYTEGQTYKFVLIGGAVYVGLLAKFRITQYFAIFAVPFYGGVEGSATGVNESGVSAINPDTITADRIVAEANGFESELKFDSKFQLNASISVYGGVGLCGTIGVRGGFYFSTNLMWYPTVKTFYPTFDSTGGIFSFNLKLWVDLLHLTIPSPAYNFKDIKFGYHKQLEDSAKEDLELMSASDDEKPVVMLKPRNSKDSVWMPEDDNLSFLSTFEEDTSTVLVENGFDRADSQLLDLGDGRIMLAYIADDPERSDEERTALMYSIYEDGVWSDPVMVQDDGTADFTPDICNGNDKVYITWTSREPGLEYISETEFLKSMEVYTTTLDKATLTIGEIEKLTEDEFYDSDPKGLFDENSGDYMVYYLKADVSEDFIASMSPTTNESVIVYMLHDASENKWARDYYYDNEVENEEAEDYLVTYWGGQRFLSSPIKDFSVNDPVIIDFDAISYNGIGVYTFTVDKDNNLDTPEDRELFVQFYNFEDHSTYVPVRITNDNITDARPQLVRSGEYTYLFWLQNNKDIRYINLSDLVKYGVNEDGTISEDCEISCGAVFYSPSQGADVQPTFGNYNAFVDKDNNLFVTWLQPVKNEDGSDAQEIYASALIRQGYENTGWSEGVRLTNSGAFHDEVAFLTDANGDLMTVSNQFKMNDDVTDFTVQDVKLVATKFKTVGSLEIDGVEYSKDAPNTGSTIDVTAKIKNTGLKPAKGYTLNVYEKVNGEVGEKIYSVVSDEEIVPSNSQNVTFGWTLPESYEGINDLSLYLEVQEADMEEIGSYSSESIKIGPMYKIVEYSVEERSDGFYATYSVENIGNIDSVGRDDKVAIKFSDLYFENVEVEPYLEEHIGDLAINETKTFVKPLKIGKDRFEFGYTNASIMVVDSEGKRISDYETFMIVLEHPYDITVNGDKEIKEIRLRQGSALPLSVDYSPSDFYNGAEIGYEIKDSSVASVTDDKLVANRVGETEMTMMVVPFGGEKTVKVVVEPAVTSGGGGGGGGGVSKLTITLNTNGGNKLDSIKVDKNSVIGDIEEPVKEGFVFDGWYLDKELTKKADPNKKVTSDITLYAKWIEWTNPFIDVSADDWFYESVKYANINGLFGGTSEETFSPKAELTRSMLVTVLHRADGEPKEETALDFTDVAEDAYYTDAVSWAQKNGIVSGVSENEFAPDAKITREQIATIMYRYAIYKGVEAITLEENLSFKDAGDISEYAVSAMNWIVGQEIIKGYEDNTVKPKNNATRAEAATMLKRFIEKINSVKTK